MLCLALLSLLAAAPEPPKTPSRWVTDEAGLLSPRVEAALDQRLEGYQQQTGHQVLVWIGKTTAGEPIELFAERAFRQWKVGRAGLDDGAVLFVFADDRTLRIEVGYGLEPTLTDAVASRIIAERITPLLKAGDPDGAISAGVDALVTTIGGAPLGPAPTTPKLTTPQWVALGVGAVGFLLLLIIRPDLALRLLTLMIFFGRNGRGRGRGGFSGGGGRSGGGGASGRW